MSQFPKPILTDGADTGASTRPTVTLTGGAAHTLSASFTELEASLSADAGGMYLKLTSTVATSNVNTSALVAIYTGASSSEVLWATVGFGYMMSGASLYVPGFIAAGTRVSAKCQGAVASETVELCYAFLDVAPGDVGPPVTIGADMANSRGTQITNPASVNTKGAWLELEDSTTDDICAILVCVAQAGDVTHGNGGLLVDIGVGAAAAETVVIADVALPTNSSEQLSYHRPTTYAVDIPAGSRIAARYARASAADQCDVLLVAATVT